MGTDRVLVAEVTKSKNRWNQVNFDKATFENFFGATAGGKNGYRILLNSIDDNGVLGKNELRPGVSVSSSNYRFEIGAGSGKPYPLNGRPCIVFVEVSIRTYIYELFLPGDTCYNDVMNFISNWRKVNRLSNNKLCRAIDVVDNVKALIPNIGLWKL